AWSALPAVIGCLTLTFILWVGLRDRELAYVAQRTAAATDALATEVKRQVDQQILRVERLARERADKQDAEFSIWKANTQQLFDESRSFGCVMIELLDAQGRNTWYYPTDRNEFAAGFNHHDVPARDAALLSTAHTPYDPAVSATT